MYCNLKTICPVPSHGLSTMFQQDLMKTVELIQKQKSRPKNC